MKLNRSVGQRLGLMLGGIAAAALLVVGAEYALRLFDIGAERGLFTAERGADGRGMLRLFWNPQFNKPVPPGPQRDFPADKPPGAFRIFVIGESSAEGTPYGSGRAFSWWLAQRLQAQLPEVHWQVVNAALASAQSGSMLVMVRDIAKHAPDLLVVYLGHNEVGGHLTAAERARLDPGRFHLRALLARSRLCRVLARALPAPVKRLDARQAQPPAAVPPVGSPDNYASDADRAVIARVYRARVAEMVRVMRKVGARTALLTLSQNLSDWPPVVSVHGRQFDTTATAAFAAAVQEGDDLAPHDCGAALAAWRRASALDDGFAALHFKMAGCERSLGQLDVARADFRLASELDRFSQGAPLAFNDILREVAERDGALLVDVDAALTRASGDRLVGDDLFVDAMHPNLRAHQLIAAAVADAMRLAGIPLPADRWRPDAYVDPNPETIFAADPELRVNELVSRAVVCFAAGRNDCAFEQLAAAKSATRNDTTRQAIERFFQTAPAAAAPKQQAGS